MSPNDPSYDKSYFLTPLSFNRDETEKKEEAKQHKRSRQSGGRRNERWRIVFSSVAAGVFQRVGSLDREEAERLKRRG